MQALGPYCKDPWIDIDPTLSRRIDVWSMSNQGSLLYGSVGYEYFSIRRVMTGPPCVASDMDNTSNVDQGFNMDFYPGKK